MCFPLAPAVLWTIREWLAQGDAIQADERGLAAADSLWRQAMDGKITEAEAARQSALLQDALFDNRSRSPLVFDWIYRLLRQRKEAQTRFSADEMVDEAIARLGLSKPSGNP